jgi:hypothetical protein
MLFSLQQLNSSLNKKLSLKVMKFMILEGDQNQGEDNVNDS